jgi:hypothetical protein
MEGELHLGSTSWAKVFYSMTEHYPTMAALRSATTSDQEVAYKFPEALLLKGVKIDFKRPWAFKKLYCLKVMRHYSFP